MPTSVTHYGAVVVLCPRDELNAETNASFTEAAQQEVEAGNTFVVVDCSQLHGLDSAGLETLLEVQARCEEGLGAAKLCGLDDTCAKIMQITRLDRRFEIFSDLDSAVRSFS